MKRIGEFLQSKRTSKKISLEKASRDLHIAKVHIKALEESDWKSLPEPAFVKGFIKTYAKYLNLDEEHILALYRREYDERKFPQKADPIDSKKRLFLTPNKLINLAFIFGVLMFIGYLTLQYTSILSTPKLEIISPKNDINTSVPYVLVSGKAEKEATVAVDGEFVPVDTEGNFSKEVKLENGQNIMEIVASKRLSPKAKATRVVRLTSR